MDSKFVNFIKPFLNYIDEGHFFRKPFRVLYMVLAILSLLIPLFFLYTMIDNKMFSGTAKMTVGVILLWLFVAVAYWLVFQIWWSRKDDVGQQKAEGEEFVSTPVFAHFIQTGGESLGVLIAIAGAGFSLVSFLFLGDASRALSNSMGIAGSDNGILGVVISPVVGFIIIVFSRFLSEQIKALATIANNTKK